jgi:siderophore synthetase component
MTTLARTALDAAVSGAHAQLRDVAPGLTVGFVDALPSAVEVVARRLVSAAYREDLAGLRAPGALARLAPGSSRHGFDRPEVRGLRDPDRLLAELPERVGGHGLAVELADAAVNLAVAYARRVDLPVAPDTVALAAGLSPDDQAVFFERLSTEGHNLHPCGRTRLGWSVADLLAYDVEADRTAVGFVAVRRDLHVGDDVGALLGVPAPRAGYVVRPVHAWQLERVVRHRYADLLAGGALIPLDGPYLTGAPTAALRTLLLDAGPVRRYLKVSLDIQVTSTRRTISVASTRNGPALSDLLHRLLADEPRVLLMAEEAGAATAGSRDLAAIVRRGLDGRLAPDEVAVPGGALYATSPLTGRTVLAELVDRSGLAPLAFVDSYARLVLPPLLRLATRHGIGVEAHLQNCIPTFRDGVPHRLALRDFAGLRIHLPRLHGLALWPGSVIGTGDADVMRAKLGYTLLQAHLGEVILRLVESHDLDESAAWRAVREVVDEVYDELRGWPAAAGDHAFLTAPVMPHKALVRMRLGGPGDVYVPVRNPLR